MCSGEENIGRAAGVSSFEYAVNVFSVGNVEHLRPTGNGRSHSRDHELLHLLLNEDEEEDGKGGVVVAAGVELLKMMSHLRPLISRRRKSDNLNKETKMLRIQDYRFRFLTRKP